MEKLITNPHHSKADLGHFDFELVLRKPKLQLGIFTKMLHNYKFKENNRICPKMQT